MIKRICFVLIAALLSPLAANAGLIASFGTGSTGSVVGGSFSSTNIFTDTNNGAYFQGATIPASNWVWPADVAEVFDTAITFSFDLTGFDLDTVALGGVWGVDNVGQVSLNGILLSSLPDVVTANFNTLTSFSADQASLFNQGGNDLVFSLGNRGGPGAFRAAGTVTGTVTVSEVPAPATLALLSLGLAGLGWSRRKKA